MSQGRKENTELNLGVSVVLILYQFLKNTYSYVFFDNFFNSFALIQKLIEDGLYGLRTARCDRENMLELKEDNEIVEKIFKASFTEVLIVITTSEFCLLVVIWKKLHRFLLCKGDSKTQPAKLTSLFQTLLHCRKVK